MATYLILNIFFVIPNILAGLALRWKPCKVWLATLLSLFIMTAVFDSLIIHFNIVAYDLDKILGVFIAKAPIEDFFYAVAASIITPALWLHFTKNEDNLKYVV